MKLTHATLYALKAIAFLAAREDNSPAAAEAIAEGTGAPAAFLRRILGPLAKDGMLAAVAGPGGGYRLGRPVQEITVLDVVEAVQGQLAVPMEAVNGQALPALDKALQEAAEGARAILGKVAVTDLMGNGQPAKKQKAKGSGKRKAKPAKEGVAAG